MSKSAKIKEFENSKKCNQKNKAKKPKNSKLQKV